MTVRPARRQLREPELPIEIEAPLRIDAVEKTLGSAAYLDDLREPDGCLHAAVVASTHPHADIRSIDADAALAIPGVEAIFDRNHLYGMDVTCAASEFSAGHARVGEMPVLATDRARFEGDVLGMVAARDRATARAAARAVVVSYDPLPVVLDYDGALRPDAPIIHEDNPDGNVAFRDEFRWGDLEAGFADADHISEHEYYAGNAFHRPIEPTTACLAVPEDGGLTVWAPLHQPYFLTSHISPVLGLDPEQIRVRVPFIGGGFGSKHLTQAVVCTAAMAHALQRPVKYLPTDRESYRTTARHAIRYKARVGTDASGRILALDVDLEIDTGAYFTGAGVVAHNACTSAWGCYAIPHFRVRATSVYTNKVPAATFRGTGKNQTTFAIESILDEIALRLDITPQEIRKRNVLKRGEFVADRWVVRGREYVPEVPPMDTDFAELIDKASEGIGWTRESPARTENPTTQPDRRVLRGRGLALSLRHGSAAGDQRADARLELDDAGIVTLHHNAPDLGSGVYTMLALVAATELGIPVERVRVGHPDSANHMAFAGTSAQRTTVQIGNAVRAASRRLVADLVDLVAQVKGGDASEWTYRAGSLYRGDESYTAQELLADRQGRTLISAVGSYETAPTVDPAFSPFEHWAPGAAAAEVEVDCDTGEVRLLRYCAVADVGTAIHRTSVIRQVEGGAIMGFGLALHEELVYDDEGLTNGDSWSYRVPTIADMPREFTVVMVENRDGPGPFGAKGVAQTSLPCVTPAVGNAIRDAIGQEMSIAPFTPERVLAALRSGTRAVADGRDR